MGVKRLFENSNDSTLLTPRQVLEIAIDDIDNGVWDPNKLLVVSLNDLDDNYIINWSQSNMKTAECISLCECAKTTFLAQMNLV